jgi:PAS domain S-box-containing protein
MTSTRTRPLILNVDDNEAARYAKSRILKLAGFDVLEAGTGAQALDITHQLAPDLVLLDMKLPDIHGLDVCRRIKGDPTTASTLVLQTSASAVRSLDKIKALDGGADSYLVEPMEGDELIANINALLRMRKAEQLFQDAQRALGESEERFRQMAENIDDVFWVVRIADGRVLYVSPAYEKIWGRSIETLLQERSDWLQGLHPDDRERVEMAYREALQSGDFDVEFRVVHPNGELRWIRARGYPVRDIGGAYYRLAGVSQDISARKQAETLMGEHARLLAEQNNRLESMVAERTAALSSLSIHLQNVTEQERAQLARELHDELGSVLTAAQMDVGWVLKQIEPSHPALADKLRRAMQTLHEGVTVKRRILEDLRPSSLEHLGIAGAMRSYVMSTCERAGMDCAIEIGDLPPDIDDRMGIALYRIVQEGLTNVLKHAQANRFRAQLHCRDGRLTLELEDNGVGFTPQALSRVGHHGIAGMRQRVIAMNGDFLIENREPGGTAIRIAIPLGMKDASPAL